jgi:hypothetical protein
MPKWIKGLYSPTGLVGWLIVLVGPIRSGIQWASEVDFVRSSWPRAAAFIDTSLGFATIFLIGCAILGFAIVKQKSRDSDRSTGELDTRPARQAPVLVAKENSAIHYTVNNIDNRLQLSILANRQETIAANVASLRMTSNMDLLNAANVSSVVDRGRGAIDILFARPIDPERVIADVRSGHTHVGQITAAFASVEFEEGKVPLIDVRFALKAPIDRAAAVLRLTQLRGEGVVTRNSASELMFTSDLDRWSGETAKWMQTVAGTIKTIDAADAEWFLTLGEVPPARVSIPNLRLGGDTDRAMFTKSFREHDFRLARLDKLLAKYGVGA